jgi:hypothetical protein
MKNIGLIIILMLNALFASAQFEVEENPNEFNDDIAIDTYINVTLYPNPSKGYFSIKMKNKKPYNVTIYSMSGAIIYSRKNVDESIHKVNLESLVSKGFYHVVFRQGENAIVKRLIIS